MMRNRTKLAIAVVVLLVVAGVAWRVLSIVNQPDIGKPFYAIPFVPSEIRAPLNETVTLMARGKGVQIYTCVPNASDSTKFAWTLKAPDAQLMDANGQIIGKHYAGPTWESTDGSKVVGTVVNKTTSDPTAIPWLLLKAASNDGNGVFSKVTSIERIKTTGGIAPATGCDATHANSETRVDYTADYYFFTRA